MSQSDIIDKEFVARFSVEFEKIRQKLLKSRYDLSKCVIVKKSGKDEV